MKTLLVTTDFSAHAKHAAEYGYNLARQIKANVLLCNAVMVPSEIPQAAGVVWPAEEYDMLMEESSEGLRNLKKHLEHFDDRAEFNPEITVIHKAGLVTEVANEIIANHEIDLVITGTHGSSGLSQLLLGNHSKALINGINKTILLVPQETVIGPIAKIAFALDFKTPEKDLEEVYSLIPLARLLNAEILVTHIYNERFDSPDFKQLVSQFLTQLSNKANYPHIYYRVIKNKHAEAGLDWLCVHGQVDILAMVHRPHNFLKNIFQGSHTQKMAGHITVPLLVFQGYRY